MKKEWKAIDICWGILFVLSAVLGSWVGQSPVFAATDQEVAQVILHKKKALSLPNVIQNSGKEMTEFDQYQGLGDVSFTVYNVTNQFYEQRNNGKSVEEAQQAVQELTPGEPITSGTTDAQGSVTLELPKSQNGKDAVYVIKEEPKAGVVAAGNMVLAFPVYEMIKQPDGSYQYGTEELDTIHLYPKNLVSNNGVLQVKKVGTAENEPLNGAVFNISKTEGAVKKYLHSVKDGLYTWTTDQTAAKSFLTGKTYHIGTADFIEENSEKGQMEIYGLEVGHYLLEEVKAPDNAALIESQTKTAFEITENNRTSVEKTIKNDTSKVEKSTPKLNGKDVAIGEMIQYEIKVNLPEGIADKEGSMNKYTKFNLIDQHDAALTFHHAVNGTNGYALYDGETTIDPSHYTVIEQENGFTVAVDPAYIPSLTPGGTLKFIYYMYLNDQANPTTGYQNEANVENDYTKDQTPPTVEVVTGGKQFIKVDGAVSTNQPLAGASFVVRDQDSSEANYLLIDPQTKAVNWTKEQGKATVFTTEKDGLITIIGLAYGTYYLEEIKAPENYVQLTNRLSFVVDEQSYHLSGQVISPEKVPNKHKGTLPSTGGKGIYLYLTIGTVLLIMGIGYFVKVKKSHQ